jgi:hypothetical protein
MRRIVAMTAVALGMSLVAPAPAGPVSLIEAVRIDRVQCSPNVRITASECEATD